MAPSPAVLIVTTQTWLQVVRLAMRLATYGCRVSAICPEESPLSVAPQIASVFRYAISSPHRALRHAIAASGAEFVVPTDDLSVWLLHDLADAYPEYRALVQRSLGDSAAHPLLRSRFRTLALARNLGIAVPRTELVRDIPDLRDWCAPVMSPCILKKDGTWGGLGVQVARSPEEAQDAFHTLARAQGFWSRSAQWLRNGDGSAFARVRCLRHPEITVQAFIRGVPANSMYACYEGKLLGEVQARVAATRGKTGPSLVIQLISDPRITRAAQRLAQALNLSGFFGLDFMIDAETQEPYLIELNPRATQLGHIAVAGQADLAGLLWARWTGSRPPAPAEAGLGNAVWFYPDGERLTRRTASFADCRPDVPPVEAELLERLMQASAPMHTRLRRSIWSSLSQLKGSVGAAEHRQAFYYPDLSKRDPLTENSTAERRGSVVVIAS